jgi:hypothetical protein
LNAPDTFLSKLNNMMEQILSHSLKNPISTQFCEHFQLEQNSRKF